MPYLAIDTETLPFAAGAILPKMICASYAEKSGEAIVGHLQGNGDKGLYPTLRAALEAAAARQLDLVFHNAAFDLGVIAANFNDLLPLIWRALDAGSVHDTGIRERLIILSTTGSLKFLEMPDGSNIALTFSLAELEKRYLGRDRSGDKSFEEAWRGHYQMLDGKRADEFPPEAYEYAVEDARGTLGVFLRQEHKAAKLGASLVTDRFQVGVDFCLMLMSAYGIRCDERRRDEIAALLRNELSPSCLPNLVRAGILIPPKPPRLIGKGEKQRWTKGAPAKQSNKKLHALIIDVCEAHGLEVQRNEATETAIAKAEAAWDPADGPFDPSAVLGTVKADKDVLEDLRHLHPALEEYAYRSYLNKLVTTEIPRMSGPMIHPRYRVMVETGRTSSFSSDKYPSANIQNVSAVKQLQDEHGEPSGVEINIRHCYVARPGKVLASIDFGQMEFCSMGQTCFSLFGFSVMRDLINGGKDPHAYLGAQIALAQHADFIRACSGFSNDTMAVYDAFKACADGPEDQRKFYEQYRKLAKPVGFGFPGGLGAAKFVSFAKSHPYYVKVTEEQAKELKRLWLSTFPEMESYFDLIKQGGFSDPNNPERYRYTTPLGMIRAGATYTACANGRLLQSPGAEGAKMAVWEIVRSCYDPGYNDVLCGQKPIAFIHDEILFEFDDDANVTERALEAARVMVQAFMRVLPDVRISAEPALMYRWDKSAKPKYDQQGRLIPWDSPLEESHVAA